MGLNVFDQQIIDIKGKNIVRVNDVVIQEKPQMTISGIDIGLFGIARWLGIEKPAKKIVEILNLPIHDTLLPWSDIQPLELSRGKVVMNKEEDKLKSIAPEDLADYLEKTSIFNAIQILTLVTDETASEVIQNLNINYQTQLFQHMPTAVAAQIITHADPDEAADLLLLVSEEKREEILSMVTKEKKKELAFLLEHAETSLGELMTTEFLVFSSSDTVKTVIERIRKETAGFANFPYGYVVNKSEELIGAFSLHELLLQSPETPILKFLVPNVIVVHPSTPKAVAVKRMLKYKLRAIPVMSAKRTLLGIVTFDDLVEPLLQKGELV
jgi:Mg/Co/Ni transporter MgtE